MMKFFRSNKDEPSTKGSDDTGDTEKAKEEKVLTEEEKAKRDELFPYLMMRCYHLPHNDWKQDLWQYMVNNHPVFGIFLHHVYHPVGTKIRILGLIGSVLFGLAITNIIYLAFVFTDRDYDRKYIEVSYNVTGSDLVDRNVPAVQVTNGNIALWTVGAALHALYDNVIWSLSACTCFMKPTVGVSEKAERYRSASVFLVMLSVVAATALATFAVTLRNAIDSGKMSPEEVRSYGAQGEQIKVFEVRNAESYEFIIAYLIELALNYFGYYPVVGTVLFTGILGCFKYTIIGGRPAEIKEMKARRAADRRAADEKIEEGVEVEIEPTT